MHNAALTFEDGTVPEPGEEHKPTVLVLREVGQPFLALLQPFVVPIDRARTVLVITDAQSLKDGLRTHPSQTTAQRFFPLMLAHIPVWPSTSASLRALIVLSDLSSCLLKCGTSPHFIVCRIRASSGCEDVALAPGWAWPACEVDGEADAFV